MGIVGASGRKAFGGQEAFEFGKRFGHIRAAAIEGHANAIGVNLVPGDAARHHDRAPGQHGFDNHVPEIFANAALHARWKNQRVHVTQCAQEGVSSQYAQSLQVGASKASSRLMTSTTCSALRRACSCSSAMKLG